MAKLLIVDDNEQNRHLFQVLLARHGYEVIVASDGAEALTLARDDPPDMIVSDILMPGMDGYALCRQWKRDETLKKVPFVFYTATYTDPKDKQLALSMGADLFIVKPQELEVLLDMLKDVIEAHDAGRLSTAHEPAIEEAVYLNEYNAALVRKLEDKLVELESTRARLECEMAERDYASTKLEALAKFPGEEPFPVLRIADNGTLLYANRASVTVVEHEQMEVGGVVPERWLAWLSQAFTAASNIDVELDCGTQCFSFILTPIVESGYANAYGRDITERKKAEHDLVASETRYRRLFESAKDGILILDAATGQIVDVNPFLVDLLGFTHDYFLGKRLWEMGLFRDIAASEAAFVQLQEKGYIRYEDLPLETNDGRRIDVEFVSNVYLVNSAKVVQCNIRNITERKSLEEQLQQAQKMESIGQLAGGVAHDFNNILQAIVGYSSMLLDCLPKDDAAYEYAEEIAQGAEHAAALTSQLLAFSRRQILKMEDLQLNEVVPGLTKMIRRIIGEDVEVVVAEGRRLDIVHADRGQMEQVLLNLCINARDAMPNGGTLSIGTENVAMDKAYCSMHAWASPGRYVLLSVTDTGCGMDAATKTRIFEPFFTTKELGKGTGLGLATVYGIVRQHQGMIQVYSEVDTGTVFKVYLPSFERTAVAAETEVVECARGGTETILLAEDDDMLRKLAMRVLESAGYTVLSAANGKEALEVFEEHKEEVAMCLLDVVMPKMGGKAVYDALCQQHPSLRFLFSSGYSIDAIHTSFVLKEGIELLQKPYAPDSLLRKVRRVLDKTHEASCR